MPTEAQRKAWANRDLAGRWKKQHHEAVPTGISLEPAPRAHIDAEALNDAARLATRPDLWLAEHAEAGSALAETILDTAPASPDHEWETIHGTARMGFGHPNDPWRDPDRIEVDYGTGTGRILAFDRRHPEEVAFGTLRAVRTDTETVWVDHGGTEANPYSLPPDSPLHPGNIDETFRFASETAKRAADLPARTPARTDPF